MSYNVTKYPQGTFSWADVSSTDIEKTKTFMTQLMGWTFEDMPTPMGVDYTMFFLEGRSVAGGSQMPPEYANRPSYWSNYVTVDNVDEIALKAQELGGTIIMPAMDVMNSGRMVGIQDPTGAICMYWQPANHIGAGVVNTIGAMCWNELYTNDIEKAKEFYNKLLGWTYDVSEDMNNYVSIMNNGRNNGGMMEITPDMGDFPPNWTVYFTVRNIEETVNQVNELGGHVYMQKDIGIGKIAMIADPTGAAFIVMEMGEGMEPTPWEE